ncbi:MAG: transporter substrate-binding domain-containing protein [Actinobacteria bacterium]|nr:transporter substrate-binding domain-containing protein [Actinomycetota bacterium]MCG2808228.1 transporter substrate-binding domain-containing protein [Coriobacteriia bacterium]
MMKMRNVLLATAMLAAMALLAGCGDTGTADANASAEKFVYANSGAYKPFSFDEGGEIVGFDVDIANEVAKRIGREPVMQSPVPFDALIQGLKAGKYDALVASHGITDERKEVVDFSRPYYRSGAQIFVVDSNSSINAASDLAGKKIGVVKASTYLELANSLTDQGNVTTYDSDVIALADLETGRVDAVITDKLVGLIAKSGSGLPIKAVGDVLQQDEMGIVVQKGDTELMSAINTALDAMIADGTYEEISIRWFDENILGE